MPSLETIPTINTKELVGS